MNDTNKYILIAIAALALIFSVQKEELPTSFNFDGKEFIFLRDANFGSQVDQLFSVDGLQIHDSKEYFALTQASSAIDKVGDYDTYVKFFIRSTQAKQAIKNFTQVYSDSFAYNFEDKTVYSTFMDIGGETYLLAYVLIADSTTPPPPNESMDKVNRIHQLLDELNDRPMKIQTWISGSDT